MNLQEIIDRPEVAYSEFKQLGKKITRLEGFCEEKDAIIKRLKGDIVNLKRAQTIEGRRIYANTDPMFVFQCAIKAAQSSYPDLSEIHVKSKSRAARMTEFRQIVATLVSSKMTLKNSGELLGGRDHSTIIHSKQKVNDKCDLDADFRRMYTAIHKQFITLIDHEASREAIPE